MRTASSWPKARSYNIAHSLLLPAASIQQQDSDLQAHMSALQAVQQQQQQLEQQTGDFVRLTLR